MTYILTNPNSRRIMDVLDSLGGLQEVDPTVLQNAREFIFGGYRTAKADGIKIGGCIDDLERGTIKFEGYFH